jgi:hypothetical protein
MDEPILTKEQIHSRRFKEIVLTKSDYSLIKEVFEKHSSKYDFFNYGSGPTAGQHFLYQILKDKRSSGEGGHIGLSYPKLGIYLNSYPCDQTIEVEWTDHRRTWEYNFKFNEYGYVGEQLTELQYLPLWMDKMLVYGVWDVIPNWKQLKQAYERTWWYYRSPQEIRDIQINRLLNGK